MVGNMETGGYLNKQIEQLFEGLSAAINCCSNDRYSLPLPLLSGASIGEHTRHIIEFFQCLLQAFEQNEVDYNNRKRNRQIETEKNFALQILQQLSQDLQSPDKALQLSIGKEDNGRHVILDSSYYRELAYNIEHAIHHMAIIKIGLKSLQIDVDENFGVAPSTIEYRKSCAS